MAPTPTFVACSPLSSSAVFGRSLRHAPRPCVPLASRTRYRAPAAATHAQATSHPPPPPSPPPSPLPSPSPSHLHAHAAARAAPRVTEAEVLRAQQRWGAGVVRLGQLAGDRAACEAYASVFLDDLYAFPSSAAGGGADESHSSARTVLFKPTRAAAVPFRPTRAQALSYFIAGPARACPEDAGFALSPPWAAVRFENAGIVLEQERALAMGHYYFADEAGEETKVEFTFGYAVVDGQLKIDLHHSSLPFNPAQ